MSSSNDNINNKYNKLAPQPLVKIPSHSRSREEVNYDFIPVNANTEGDYFIHKMGCLCPSCKFRRPPVDNEPPGLVPLSQEVGELLDVKSLIHDMGNTETREEYDPFCVNTGSLSMDLSDIERTIEHVNVNETFDKM